MRTFLRVLLAFLSGLIVTYVVAVAGLFAYVHAIGVVDRDGGLAMGIVFMIGPLAGIVGGTISAIAVPIWLARRDVARVEGRIPPGRRWPLPLRVAIATFAAGVPVYLSGWFALWLLSPQSFTSYGTALAVSYAPVAAAAVGAAVAVWVVLRQRRPTAS